MEKYKLIGLTESANHISDEELQSLRDLIGTECEESNERNLAGDKLMKMADGDFAYKGFLILEQIK